MPELMSESRKKAMRKAISQELQDLRDESDEVNDPGSRKYEGDDEAKLMQEEAKKRASEKTGAWRKRQGLGKPEWFESEY